MTNPGREEISMTFEAPGYIYIYICIRIWSLCVYVFDEHRAGFRAAPDAKAASGGFLTAWVMPQPFGVLPTFSTRKA